MYNPFYTLVMQRLLHGAAQHTRSYQVTLQYALWDIFRNLGESGLGEASRLNAASAHTDTAADEVSDRRLSNIAHAFGWWIGKGSLPLAVLKVHLKKKVEQADF